MATLYTFLNNIPYEETVLYVSMSDRKKGYLYVYNHTYNLILGYLMNHKHLYTVVDIEENISYTVFCCVTNEKASKKKYTKV